MKKDVNIYIECQLKGPQRKTAKYGYVMEFVERDGGTSTLTEIGCLKNTTAQRLVVAAVARALGRVKAKSRVCIFTDSQYFQNAIMQCWMYDWEAAGWKNARGKKVANADIWQMVMDLEAGHDITVYRQDSHQYSAWLADEMGELAVEPGKSRIIYPE